MIQIHTSDTVAVALHPISKGDSFAGITALEDIPQGHKMAIKPINVGDNVIKFGCPIGHATEYIEQGAWVHTHNMATNLSEKTEYSYQPQIHWPEKKHSANFWGFRRPNGKVAIRNEIWIIPTVGCVNDVAKALARENQDLVNGTVDGLYAYPHPFGCSQTGEDHVQTRRLLAALVHHPNAAGVLVIGLGCENLTMEQFCSELGTIDESRVRCLICQQVTDEMIAGRALLEQLATYARSFNRQPIPVSELIVGMKCGGSDGLSGITANPVVGRFSDMLIASGGSTILTEVPEMFGAEKLLMNRCINENVYQKAMGMIAEFKAYFIRHHEVVYDNPSPGNKEGGITTLEEKACGCVQKGGLAPITGVMEYADMVTEKGLNLLYGPGNDLVSATALTAAGAHLILFTTGRGTPFGAPVPTIKIATNSMLAEKKSNWIDFNAGTVADGKQTLVEATEDLFDLVLSISSGALTRSEERGYREISIFKDGVVL